MKHSVGKLSVEKILGGVHCDGRGKLRFCNDFDASKVRRFYTISNASSEPVRGWILHRKETKWFFPLVGETIIHWQIDGDTVQHADQLSAQSPAVLCIPPFTWFAIEQSQPAEVMVFSDCKIGTHAQDDFRRPYL